MQDNLNKLKNAVCLHQQGRLDQAAVLYQEILVTTPQHVDALQLLATIAVQRKQSEEAIRLFDRVLEIKPDYAEALNNRGAALRDLQRFEQALDSYDRALQIKPDYADALNNRGNVLRELKRDQEALDSYQLALQIKPDYAEAWCNRADVLFSMKDYQAAIANYDQALAIKGEYPEALNNRGNALHYLGLLPQALICFDRLLELRPGDASASNNRGNVLLDSHQYEQALFNYEQALRIRPDYAEAFSNRAAALHKLARYDEALESVDQALAINPEYLDAMFNRGDILLTLNRFQQALACFDQVLQHKPDHVEALNYRGSCFYGLEDFELALQSYQQALGIRPDYADALYNAGTVLHELKRLPEAIVSYQKAVALNSEYVDAQWNLGLCQLQLGDFLHGWRQYEWRWRRSEYQSQVRQFPQSCWTGEQDLSGKTLFVHAEQGLGDTLQFCRYVRLLADLGAKVILEVQPPLLKLLESLEGVAQLTSRDKPLTSFDYHCPLLSLPLVLNTAIDSIPNSVPYLFVDHQRVLDWRQKLAGDGFKIGINWQGNRAGKVDIGRSFLLENFRQIAAISGVRLISLQKNEGAEQLQLLSDDFKVEVLNSAFDTGPDAFLDTAAIMLNLDLVITSDTSVAHLAGALGCPVWVAVKFVPDWRWLLEGEENPWYPTMRVFRQVRRGVWSDVFAEIYVQLLTLLKRSVATFPLIPVSWGELIDKMTVLEIREKNISDCYELKNIKNEQLLLNQALEKISVADIELMNLKSTLKIVNQALWDIENQIRKKEADQSFDEQFIELARSVYRLNDERFRIKNEIDLVIASEIVEEKGVCSYQQ